MHSTLLRYIVETLFIVHGETALNMICPLGGSAETRYECGYDPEWCRHIYPRPVSSNPTPTATTTTDPSLSNMMTSL